MLKRNESSATHICINVLALFSNLCVFVCVCVKNLIILSLGALDSYETMRNFTRSPNKTLLGFFWNGASSQKKLRTTGLFI